MPETSDVAPINRCKADAFGVLDPFLNPFPRGFSSVEKMLGAALDSRSLGSEKT